MSAERGAPRVRVEAPPRFDATDAERLARELYGIEGRALELPSERDRNFRISAADGERLLKVANPAEPEAQLRFEVALLEHLAGAGLSFPVQRVLPARDGSRIAAAAARDGCRCLVRLLSFLPGVPLAAVRPKTPDLFREIGLGLGQMDSALLSFRHPAAERELQWDLARAGALLPRAVAIRDPERRRLVEGLLERFAGEIEPRLRGRRRSVVHNDWNDHNVLVSPASSPERRLAGVVDFGDALASHTVCDLAIAVAYAMLGERDPLGAAALVVGGYHDALPLEEPELGLVFELARTRLAASVTLAAEQAQRAPGNDYLRISEAPAWSLLERLARSEPAWAECRLRDACGLPASRRGAAVVAALRSGAVVAGPVVERDLNRALVLDLSVASPDVEPPTEQTELAAGAEALFERIARSGAQIGIGRYDEARLVYASDAYRLGDRPCAERRSIHLGIDLFLRAGEPVLAPLDGEVHSVADNAAPFDYGPTVILRHRLAGEDGELFTLYGHLTRESLAGKVEGQPVGRGARIGAIGSSEVNGGWIPHLHFQIVADMLGRRGDFPGVAPPSQRGVWKSLCPDPNLLLRVPGLAPAPIESRDSLLASRRRHFSFALSLAHRSPLVIVRGRKALLFDDEGRRYLDAVNNIAHVGHGHPRVVRALSRQARLLNTNTRYLHPLREQYARRLTALLPEPLQVVFLVCSGSEANELALRLALAHTGGSRVVVLEGAYHGNTRSLIGLSPYKYRGPGGAGPAAHVLETALPDRYRGRHRGADAGARYAAHVRAATQRAAAEGGLAAFFCESLPGCAGQIVLPDGYLSESYRAVRDAGGICVADEVQVGFGRVGEPFWGFATQGVVPDVVTLGKPIGNGHPLAAVVTTPQIARSFETGMELFNSFGGNPVSCAAGLAVLDVLRDERLPARATEVGEHLKRGLNRLAERHPLIGDVRGLGLFLGIELVRDRDSREPAGGAAAYVVERMKESGVLVSRDGPEHNVLKIKPPLVFDEADADQLLEVLDGTLSEDFPRWSAGRPG